ncbi:MAG: plethodontid receptivity factor PRF, partial [Prevotellaceae bacterium]|nr:plethodontid receptivity factor PRF [Prevotellaceae bacterium]
MKDMQTNGSRYKKINLKYFFVCAVLAVLSTACAAQVKVIDKSAKKAPAWVNGIEKNFLIVSATANDVEEAKEKILNSLREQIVHAVAVNVQSSAAINVQETALNGKVRQFLETTGSTIHTKSGNVPFLNEIALSNAVDYYWEKQQDKKTKAVTVIYHVKYP